MYRNRNYMRTTRPISGAILGYDPGGNGANGVAELIVEDGQCVRAVVHTKHAAEDVLEWSSQLENVIGFGVDTLAAWSTGRSGWRSADIWLRKRYPEVLASVMSPNSLSGSMGINGMAVLIALRKAQPDLVVSETHPNVLYRALTGRKYDYKSNSSDMDAALARWLDVDVLTSNDHEWDALVSAFAVLKGMSGDWTHDLFEEQADRDGRIIWPCGQTKYWWPE